MISFLDNDAIRADTALRARGRKINELLQGPCAEWNCGQLPFSVTIFQGLAKKIFWLAFDHALSRLLAAGYLSLFALSHMSGAMHAFPPSHPLGPGEPSQPEPAI